MENFITGFPGHESTYRAALASVLGQDDTDYFFDRVLHHFFTVEDAQFLKSVSLNCLRLPFNYRHFEDDMNPRVLKESGFKHLDRVIDICANEGIYTILDMHTVPGGQSPGWHADSTTSYAAFWDYKDHQDRTIWLWEQLADRYKDNPWVAGYNPINEPCDPQHIRLPAFYTRIERAIRAVDPHHILWLDGNTFAGEWKGFTSVLSNCVYSLHDYSSMGFPTGTPFTGTPAQIARLESQYLRKAEFQISHQSPIWNGEFGPVYADPLVSGEAAASKINAQRYALLGAQLAIYARARIPWSIWTYKDVGLQGMVHTSRSSPWGQFIAKTLETKRKLQLDAWGMVPSSEIDNLLDPLVSWIDRNAPQASETYPSTWNTRKHVERQVMQTFVAESFVQGFAELFRGLGREELGALAESFAFGKCVQREGLNEILMRAAKEEGAKGVEERAQEVQGKEGKQVNGIQH